MLVHHDRGREHARADVGDVEHLEHALDGAVLAVGTVQQREDDVDLAEGARRLARLVDGEGAVADGGRQSDLGALVDDLGGLLRGEPQRCRVVLDEHPDLARSSRGLEQDVERLVRDWQDDVLDIVTPAEAARRGAQLSLRVRGGRAQGRALFEDLAANGVLGDWREPDVIRISPAPLYNSHADVLRFVRAVARWRDA